MIKLLKYEFIRKWKTIIITVLGFLLINFVFVLKIKPDVTYSLENMPIQAVSFILLSTALLVVSIIGAINNLRIEVKNSTRDLYFTIPLSSYTKIGSKVIFSLVEILGAILIGSIVAMKSIESITGIKVLSLFFENALKMEFNVLFQLIISSLLLIIIILLTVYLSFAVFRSFFSQIKFGGAITIGIYLFINYIIGKFISIGVNRNDLVNGSYFNNDMFINLFLAVILFVATSYLFEKKVNFD